MSVHEQVHIMFEGIVKPFSFEQQTLNKNLGWTRCWSLLKQD